MPIPGRKPELVRSVHVPDPDPAEAGGTIRQAQLDPPVPLSDTAQEVWDVLVPDLAGTGVLRESDAVLLTELVEAIALSRWFRQELQAEMRNGGADTPEAKRLRAGWAQAAKLAWSMAAEFGVSPVARVRLGLAKVQGASLLAVMEQSRARSS